MRRFTLLTRWCDGMMAFAACSSGWDAYKVWAVGGGWNNGLFIFEFGALCFLVGLRIHLYRWRRSLYRKLDREAERQVRLTEQVALYERGVLEALDYRYDPYMPDAARWSPKLLEDTLEEIEKLLAPEEG